MSSPDDNPYASPQTPLLNEFERMQAMFTEEQSTVVQRIRLTYPETSTRELRLLLQHSIWISVASHWVMLPLLMEWASRVQFSYALINGLIIAFCMLTLNHYRPNYARILLPLCQSLLLVGCAVKIWEMYHFSYNSFTSSRDVSSFILTSLCTALFLYLLFVVARSFNVIILEKRLFGRHRYQHDLLVQEAFHRDTHHID